MKSNIFIFHGTGGYPEENWFPWIKKELEAKKYTVFVPKFPTPEGQSLEAWLKVLENYKEYINENTIFIGHSLGCMFILRILEKLSHKIKGVFLIAGMVGIKPILNYTTDYSFGGFDFDWDKVKNKSKNFVVFHSNNDPYVCLANGEQLAKELGVELSFIPNAGHFNAKAGYTTFPDLLNQIEVIL
ncbi:MAG: alpha/beta hydrolase [Patescibacteria group bacterium]